MHKVVSKNNRGTNGTFFRVVGPHSGTFFRVVSPHSGTFFRVFTNNPVTYLV